MDDFVPVSRPYIWGDEKLNLCQAIDSGWISSRGRFLDEFEDRFAEKIGTRYAVAASSGTAAVHLALSVLDLDKNDDLLVAIDRDTIDSDNRAIPIFARRVVEHL